MPLTAVGRRLIAEYLDRTGSGRAACGDPLAQYQLAILRHTVDVVEAACDDVGLTPGETRNIVQRVIYALAPNPVDADERVAAQQRLVAQLADPPSAALLLPRDRRWPRMATWHGILAQLDTLSTDGRTLVAEGHRHHLPTATTWPLMYQPPDSGPEHQPADHIGKITRVWVDSAPDGHTGRILCGAGTIRIDTPAAAELATTGRLTGGLTVNNRPGAYVSTPRTFVIGADPIWPLVGIYPTTTPWADVLTGRTP